MERPLEHIWHDELTLWEIASVALQSGELDLPGEDSGMLYDLVEVFSEMVADELLLREIDSRGGQL